MSAVTAPRRTAPRPATPPERRRRHLHVVEDAPRRHPAIFLLLYLVAGVGMVLGAVSLNALAAEDAVAARELGAQVAEEERRYELLVSEVAELEDPARIHQAAQELGLVPGPTPRFLVPEHQLPADRSVDPAPDDDLVKPLLSAGGR